MISDGAKTEGGLGLSILLSAIKERELLAIKVKLINNRVYFIAPMYNYSVTVSREEGKRRVCGLLSVLPVLSPEATGSK